ncbi:hypothetical protein Tsubulata_011073 [Turnera subulata]|uniref:DUF7798 domain-containing protein n=1 Tax=Turnera subulata TaxID=218843 RepID=A0A9Q0FB24_9ROSI|nr:hypothetical protein Tsubulata_011073 [Turnera subulata]
MEEDSKKSTPAPTENEQQQPEQGSQQKQEEPPKSSGGGWGGWGFSAFSVLSDLQKAAEEISRNAAEVAEKAAKSIVADVQSVPGDSESAEEEKDGKRESSSDKEGDSSSDKEEEDDEDAKRRKAALEKLERASEDSLLGQASISGLKVFDHSVENFASGAWQALGSAWKGGSNFVQKLEHSAVNLAGSIQNGSSPGAAGSTAPSLLETGRAFTAKGMQVLEYVGKETMDLLITEAGIDVEKNSKSSDKETVEDQLLEDVTFDRCFYIYGGPEQLEELEALSNHYALLYNRRKAKLSLEQKSAYDGKLKLVQQIFSLNDEKEGSGAESDKGKKIETGSDGNNDEIKTLHDSSVSKAADMAAGFTSALAGLAGNDIIQKTAARLETLHSEGVHRVSEMCCSAVTELMMLGKSIISNANKVQEEDAGEDLVNIDWPEDSIEKAKLIRIKAQSMTGYMEAVSNSFITGISDVAEAYAAAIKSATADSHENLPHKSIQEKANAFSELLRSDKTAAVCKIQDGLQYLAYVVISTSMPSA